MIGFQTRKLLAVSNQVTAVLCITYLIDAICALIFKSFERLQICSFLHRLKDGADCTLCSNMSTGLVDISKVKCYQRHLVKTTDLEIL